MGCSSSKETEGIPPNIPMTRDSQSRAGTQARRAPTAAGGRRTAGEGHSSRAPPSRQGQSRPGSRRELRTSSRSHSSAGSSHHHRDRHEKPKSHALSTLEEQPPDDNTIHHDISTLSTYIEQHTDNYYRSHSDNNGTSIRRRIGEVIIEDIIEGNEDGIVHTCIPKVPV